MSLCVLHIDDDENDLYLLKFAWQQAGLPHRLEAVRSGPEALAYLQRQGPFADMVRFPMPSLVLLDLRMPRMNGLEVLEWLRGQSQFQGLVVVALTASAYPDDIARACKLGANAYVQKPGSHDELVDFVRALQGFWFRFHEFPPLHREPVCELSRPELQP
jgi:CheY-like chemotaxis protein